MATEHDMPYTESSLLPLNDLLEIRRKWKVKYVMSQLPQKVFSV